jgi:tetratricopeptide (TPR) repeat protein
LLNSGKAEEALAAIDEALRLDPTLGPRYRLRARCLAKLGRKKEAAAAAARACELSPEDPLAYDTVADLAFQARRYAEAERAWRTALRLDPTSALRLNNYGAALDRQGRREEARDAYRRAIRMDPSLDISKRNLHTSVRTALGKGTLVVGGGAAVAGFKLLGIGAANSCAHVFTQASSSSDLSSFVPALIVILIVIFVIWLARRGWIAHRAREREADLEARDPELMQLYRQIDRDLADGRIRPK